MAALRKRAGIARRRRLDDEADDVSVATEMADDSQSDVSVPSDVDEDADADNSDLSEVDSSPSLTGGKGKRKVNGSREAKARPDPANRRAPSPPIARSDTKFTASVNTDIMMNGLKITGGAADDEVVDFETGSAAVEPEAPAIVSSSKHETLAERKRREHEEYKKKRDSDPAFIPNRGAFFMHDQRSPGQNGFRQFGPRGRGRGRGGIGGPYSPAKYATSSREIEHPRDDTVC